MFFHLSNLFLYLSIPSCCWQFDSSNGLGQNPCSPSWPLTFFLYIIHIQSISKFSQLYFSIKSVFNHFSSFYPCLMAQITILSCPDDYNSFQKVFPLPPFLPYSLSSEQQPEWVFFFKPEIRLCYFFTENLLMTSHLTHNKIKILNLQGTLLFGPASSWTTALIISFLPCISSTTLASLLFFNYARPLRAHDLPSAWNNLPTDILMNLSFTSLKIFFI